MKKKRDRRQALADLVLRYPPQFDYLPSELDMFRPDLVSHPEDIEGMAATE